LPSKNPSTKTEKTGKISLPKIESIKKTPDARKDRGKTVGNKLPYPPIRGQ
jgi:hypothetical protein